MPDEQRIAKIVEAAQESWLKRSVRPERIEPVVRAVLAGVGDSVVGWLEINDGEERGVVQNELKAARAYVSDGATTRHIHCTQSSLTHR